MNSWPLLVCAVLLVLALTACGQTGAGTPAVNLDEGPETPVSEATAAPSIIPTETAEQNLKAVEMRVVSDRETVPQPEPDAAAGMQKEDAGVIGIQITVGAQTIAAQLYENETTRARALSALFPMTLSMRELHGNEKYAYLEEPLPSNDSCPVEIRAGDLMLYGADCLVLFYESFETSYSYTPLGYVEDSTGLSEALGTGGVQVTFELR